MVKYQHGLKSEDEFMKKIICLSVLFFLSAAASNAHEYELYNPETREKTNALMMSVAAGSSSYYVGLYSYNLYCITGKKIKTNRKNYKSGECYPIDLNGNILSDRRPARWKEIKPGTYDMERLQLQQEFEERKIKEVPFSR